MKLIVAIDLAMEQEGFENPIFIFNSYDEAVNFILLCLKNNHNIKIKLENE